MTAAATPKGPDRLAGDLEALARLHVTPPPLTDPLAIIVWDNAGYLIPDERREVLFNELVDRVGLDADALVAAPATLSTNNSRTPSAAAAAAYCM